jgi:hypothetical protein
MHPPGQHVSSPWGGIWCEVEGEGKDVIILVGGGPGVGHGHYHPWFSRLAAGWPEGSKQRAAVHVACDVPVVASTPSYSEATRLAIVSQA